MATEGIEVSAPKLGRGGDCCNDAAGSAVRAVEHLGDAPSSGIFGGHAEAQQFHTALDAAHQGHRDDLHGHHTALTELASKAGIAGHMFTDTDESEANSLESASAAFDE